MVLELRYVILEFGYLVLELCYVILELRHVVFELRYVTLKLNYVIWFWSYIMWFYVVLELHFYYLGFLLHGIHDSQDSKGRGKPFFSSSLPLPPASRTLTH